MFDPSACFLPQKGKTNGKQLYKYTKLNQNSDLQTTSDYGLPLIQISFLGVPKLSDFEMIWQIDHVSRHLFIWEFVRSQVKNQNLWISCEAASADVFWAF